ncbi:dihydropteroate synthase [Candidatus Photodesmus blepharus]|uniref:Dihydropteroate synthase n=1 Tax=Candidatus Photodesmus blepharonis TaxID=1179155 RepID=A0A084CP74_9GAMM|nr:dihydropteroate synthase [Candidatus Photodesmus blepharus]KEY91603.1 dihydropteroate synthase [Candidatus Photodesmus blepharus]
MIISANNKQLDLSKPHIMGILNVTPDSFYDGGKYTSLNKALYQTEKMIFAGASIIDIGGESTRPGSSQISLDDELKRILPIIKIIRSKYHNVWVSIDTNKPEVMKQALEAGVDIINDICALQEPGALEIATKFQVPVCLMHTQKRPCAVQNNPQYQDITQEIMDFFIKRISACEALGIKKKRLILDPGFGFDKNLQHNYHLLSNLKVFQQLGLPILVGMSRKSMIFKLLNNKAKDCMSASVVCAAIAILNGAKIIRVHDVEETLQAIKIIEITQSNYQL